MVKAILDGRKTVTRRAIKPRCRDDEYGFMVIGDDATGERHVEKYDEDEGSFNPCRFVNPPYRTGDVLYVRETWCDVWDTAGWLIGHSFKADGHRIDECHGKHDGLNPVKGLIWRPAIHMPKEVARIFLKVTNVRVERLQDITKGDAWDEGASDPYNYFEPSFWEQEQFSGLDYKICAFAGLWDSTIKKSDIEEYGWEANPWVWVIEFEMTEKTKGAVCQSL